MLPLLANPSGEWGVEDDLRRHNWSVHNNPAGSCGGSAEAAAAVGHNHSMLLAAPQVWQCADLESSTHHTAPSLTFTVVPAHRRLDDDAAVVDSRSCCPAVKCAGMPDANTPPATNSRALLHRNEQGKWRTVCQDKLGTPHNIRENTRSDGSNTLMGVSSSVHWFGSGSAVRLSALVLQASSLVAGSSSTARETPSIRSPSQPTGAHFSSLSTSVRKAFFALFRPFSPFGSRFKLMLNTIDLARQARDTHSILLKGKGVCCRACE